MRRAAVVVGGEEGEEEGEEEEMAVAVEAEGENADAPKRSATLRSTASIDAHGGGISRGSTAASAARVRSASADFPLNSTGV